MSSIAKYPKSTKNRSMGNPDCTLLITTVTRLALPWAISFPMFDTTSEI